MLMKLVQVAVLLASGLALGGCPLEGSRTASPAKRPAAPDYQAPVAQSTAAVNRNTCYNSADLTVIRGRMLHQELVVATLQCQTSGGVQAFSGIYASYNSKFTPELVTNANSLKQMAARKRFNVDVLVTEFANRTAQRAPTDRDFCSRTLRAMEWAVDPKATTLSAVPPPYDLGPEMNIVPCP